MGLIKAGGKSGGFSESALKEQVLEEAKSLAMDTATDVISSSKKQMKETSQNLAPQQLRNDQNVKDARGALLASNPVPISPSTSTDLQEEREEQQQEVAEAKQEIDSRKQERMEEVDAALEEKIDKIKNGRPLGSNPLWLVGSQIGEWALGGLSVIPIVGGIAAAIAGFMWNMSYWGVLCILNMDIGAFIKIFFYYIFEAGASLAFGLIPLPFASALLDAGPEVISTMMGFSPHQIMYNSYKERIPDLIEQARSDATQDKQRIRKDANAELKLTRKGIRGHFAGAGLGGSKTLVLFLCLFIVFFGPLASFVPGGMPIITLTGGTGSYMILLVFVIILMLLHYFGILVMRQLGGILTFLGVNAVVFYLFNGASWLSQYLGSQTYIIAWLVIVVLFLYTLYLTEIISQRRAMTIGISILLVIILVAYIIPYMSSGRITADLDKAQTDADVQLAGINPWDKFLEALSIQQRKANGTYVNDGTIERPHEFVGVKFEGASAAQTEFYAGEPVMYDMYFSAKTFDEPLKLYPSCSIEGYPGKTKPEVVDATTDFKPVVECSVPEVPAGYHKITFGAFYPYESTVAFKAKFIDQQKSILITRMNAENNKALDVEETVGGTEVPETSAGPVVLTVANTNVDGKLDLKMPYTVVKSDPNGRKFKFVVQLQPAMTATEYGKIKSITKAEFDMPEGIGIKNCKFAKGKELTHTQSGKRWIYDVEQYFDEWKDYKTIDCDLDFDEAYIEKFLPERPGWSEQTLIFSVGYYYYIEKAETVKVIA